MILGSDSIREREFRGNPEQVFVYQTWRTTLARKNIFFRARYYEPAFGRFDSKDALATLNRYSYSSDNPLLFTDPTGLFSFGSAAGFLLNAGTQGAVVAESALGLSAATIVRGYAELGGAVSNIAGPSSAATFFNQTGTVAGVFQQGFAGSLVQSTAYLEGVNLSLRTQLPSPIRLSRSQNILNLALSLADVPNDLRDIFALRIRLISLQF